MSDSAKPSIVFCHGIWADGSCFSKVISAVAGGGIRSDVSAIRSGHKRNDVAAVKRTLDRVKSPAILVGHSYGGAVITAAGIDDRVIGLVYIAAIAPDADETSQGQQNKFPKTEIFKHIEVTGGRVWMRPEGVKYFCGDLSKEDQDFVYATTMRLTPTSSTTTHPARPGKRNRVGLSWPNKTTP